jgi:DNA-damage-inducible protein J
MASRTAEVKAYVAPDVKATAAELYAHWGMSLSDAVNVFLVKSIDVGGLPFDMRPSYDPSTVLPADTRYGSSVLPAEMDDDESSLASYRISKGVKSMGATV